MCRERSCPSNDLTLQLYITRPGSIPSVKTEMRLHIYYVEYYVYLIGVIYVSSCKLFVVDQWDFFIKMFFLCVCICVNLELNG